MSENWDNYADGWDSNQSVIAYSEQVFLALQNSIDVDGFRVLDFGCGTGLLTDKLSHHVNLVVAIDPSQKMISVLNRKCLKNVRTIDSELTQKIINDNELLKPEFDLIVASSALAFVPDYLDAVNLMKQLLKKGGYFFQWDWLKKEREAGSGFSEEEIKLTFNRAGFSECSTSIPFSLECEGSFKQVVMGVGKSA
jgi:2-polyprenyl-3-methyl-5-hydroxy-6-metoxy-1,4-benzoquinol methylase